MMNRLTSSRSQKAMTNTACELLLEVVTAVCSFILPRLILTHFGSAYNGITSSITQFISCVALLKSGIGSVTRASLYKPLANHDSYGISEVVNATEQFMRKIAAIFLVAVIGFAAVYPFLVSDDFGWFFAFSLVLILSISTVAQYYFGLTYQMVLQADQCNYIISIVNICTTVVNTAVSAALILLGCSIHVVKLGSALVFVVPPIFYMNYVRKKYKIDKTVPANKSTISQRWDALGHQIANFINTNTDIMVITVVLGVAEVSVYSIYYMVANAVKKVVTAVSSGMMAAFGNIIAKGEEKILERRFKEYEFLIVFLSTTLFTTTGILLLPFIKIYTSGVTDINYSRESFAILVCIAEYFGCLRLPYQEIIYAAGKFKETKRIAYVEAAINIIISITLVFFVGINGVIIGTIIAMAFRATFFNRYISHNIVKRSSIIAILKPLLYSLVCVCLCVMSTHKVLNNEPAGYFAWAINAVPIFLIVIAINICISLIAYRKEFVGIAQFFTNMMSRKNKNPR